MTQPPKASAASSSNPSSSEQREPTQQGWPTEGWPTEESWQAAHRVSIQQRFNDTDMLGHINNSAYLEYLEVARLALNDEYRDISGEDVLAVLASLSIEFRAEAFLGKKTEVLHLIERVGTASFAYRFRILSEGKLVAEGKTVQVQVDTSGKPKPLSEAQRGHIQALIRRYQP